MTDEWLNTEVETSDAKGPAVQALLESVGEVAGDAPESKRYDMTLTVEERDVDE